MHIDDLGGVESRANFTIVPMLTIGETELHNVPFWVSGDEQLGISGILGIKLQTLRWSADGTIELGFPSEPADLARANLCFDDHTSIASYGADRLAFVVDTGDESSTLFPSFVTQCPGATAAGQQAIVEVAGCVGKARLKKMLLPDVKLSLGFWETSLPLLAASLDGVPLWSEWHYGSPASTCSTARPHRELRFRRDAAYTGGVPVTHAALPPHVSRIPARDPRRTAGRAAA